MKCPRCGKKVSKAWLAKEGSCPSCGARLRPAKGKLVAVKAPAKKEKPSSRWYLVALFGMIIGGIIGYLRVKDRDKEMASKLFILGILTTVIAIAKIMFFLPTKRWSATSGFWAF
jgi:DNA-directed RNA polymerase subunit RPC12/RpoP